MRVFFNILRHPKHKERINFVFRMSQNVREREQQ
jgi:hypothetical protein